MAYTNVYDTTFPPDTQAAKLGAKDIRDASLNIMQRVASFGAGLLANRPTPEVNSATANWTGVTYFATDTAQLFRWNGTGWDVVSSSGGSTARFTDTTGFTYVAPVADQPGNTISIPFGLLMVGSVLSFDTVILASGSSTDAAFTELLLGGSVIRNSPNGAVGGIGYHGTLTFLTNTAFRVTVHEVYNDGTPTAADFIIDGVCPDITTNPFVLATDLKTGIGVNAGTYIFAFLSALVNK